MPNNTAPVQSSITRNMFGQPLWSLGLRPFYLLGAIFASLLVPLWILHLNGAIEINGPFSGSLWHAHEMIFGFAPAILTGFLFTAVKNWTGIATPQGWKLAALAAIWLLARILMIVGPPVAASLVDLAFLPLMALGIAVPILKSNNRRNLIIIALVLGLFVTNLAFHAGAWELIDFEPEIAFTTGLNIFGVLLTLIIGRVMPMFINNAIPGAGAGRFAIVEFLLVTSMVMVVFIDAARILSPALEAVSLFNTFFGLFLLAIAALHIIRIIRWNFHKTLGNPMVWILPLSYFWLAASVGMKGLQLLIPSIDPVIATHILAIGAMGGMMMGMTTRSALGHTGHAIEASGIDKSCFVLIQLAVIARLASFMVPSDLYVAVLSLAALFWSLAFGLFAFRYWPLLTHPRADMAL